MPNHHCCVPGCTSDQRKVNNPAKYPTLAGVTFCRFPSASHDPCARQHWAQLSGRTNASLSVHTRICSRHFPDGKPTEDNPHPTVYDKDPRTERKGPATAKTGKRGKASTAVSNRKPKVPTKKQRLTLIDPHHPADGTAAQKEVSLIGYRQQSVDIDLRGATRGVTLLHPYYADTAGGGTKRTHKRKGTAQTRLHVGATSDDEKPTITGLYKRCKLQPTEQSEFSQCLTCVRGFTSTKKLEVHLSACHGEPWRDLSGQPEGLFFCNACGIGFSDEDAFALHLGNHIIKIEDVGENLQLRESAGGSLRTTSSKRKSKKKKSQQRTKVKKKAPGGLPLTIAEPSKETRSRIAQASTKSSSLKVYRLLGNPGKQNLQLLRETQSKENLVTNYTSANVDTIRKAGLSADQENPAQVALNKVLYGSQILSGGLGSSLTQAIPNLRGCRVYRILKRTVNNVSQTTVTNISQPSVTGVNQAYVGSDSHTSVSGDGQPSVSKVSQASVTKVSQLSVTSVSQPSLTTVGQVSVDEARQVFVTGAGQASVPSVSRPSATSACQSSVSNVSPVSVAKVSQVCSAIDQTPSKTIGSVMEQTQSGDECKMKSNEQSGTRQEITEAGPKLLAQKNRSNTGAVTKMTGIELKEQVSREEVTGAKQFPQKNQTNTESVKVEIRDCDIVKEWESDDDDDVPPSSSQPVFVCPQCREEFISVQEMRFHIRTHGFVLCVSCGKYCGSLAQLVAHTTPQVHEDLVPCSQCGLGLTTAADLEKHSVLHQITFTITCDTLSRNVYEFFDFLKTVFGESFDDLNLTRESEDVEAGTKQQMDLGLFPWETSTVGKSQEELGESSQFPNILKTDDESDSINNKSYAGSSDDSDTIEKGKKIWVCLICRNVCVGIDAYKDHVSKMHTAGPFDTPSDIIACRICHTYFDTPLARAQHIKLVHRVSDRSKLLDYLPYKCNICSERFVNKSTQKRHMQTHRDDYFPCQLCKDVCSTRPELDNHIMLAHMNQPPKPKTTTRHRKKPVLCEVCGFKAVSQSSMREHKATHSEERKFACGLCDLRFKTLNRCKSHIKRHTLAGSCQCHQCPKSFTTKTDLEMHLRFHNDVRPYPCLQCGRAFHTKQNMRVHVQKYCKGGATPSVGAKKKKK